MTLSEQALHELALPLNPARVLTLPHGHRAAGLPYLPAHDVIGRANEIFGFGGWSSELLGQPFVLSPVAGDGKGELWAAMVRVTILATGASYSDMGIGERSGAGPAALEMAAKGAVSDGVKRALTYLGAQFGLVLRDKSMDRATLETEWQAAEHESPSATPPDEPVEWVGHLARLMKDEGLKLADLTMVIPVAEITKADVVRVVGGWLDTNRQTPHGLVAAVLAQRAAHAAALAETEEAFRTQFERANDRLAKAGLNPGQVSPLLLKETGRGQFNEANVDAWCAKTGRSPEELIDLARDVVRPQPAGAHR